MSGWPERRAGWPTERVRRRSIWRERRSRSGSREQSGRAPGRRQSGSRVGRRRKGIERNAEEPTGALSRKRMERRARGRSIRWSEARDRPERPQRGTSGGHGGRNAAERRRVGRPKGTERQERTGQGGWRQPIERSEPNAKAAAERGWQARSLRSCLPAGEELCRRAGEAERKKERRSKRPKAENRSGF